MANLFLKPTFFILLSIFFEVNLFAQNSETPVDKKIAKVNQLIDANKLDDAEKKMWQLVKEYPEEGKVWEAMATLHYTKYLASKKDDNLFNNISVTTKDKDGNNIENDTTVEKFKTLLANFKPSDVAFDRLLLSCREGCIKSNDAYKCSMYLRLFKIDPKVDTGLKRKAIKAYNEAESEFQKQNYRSAADDYKEAIDIEPNFYKARLYLGDVYYQLGNYTDAISSYREAHFQHPDLAEPIKYLVDANYKSGIYDSAYYYAVQGIMTFPDFSMMDKFETASAKTGKRIHLHWMPRTVLPNSKKEATFKASMNDDEKKMVTPDANSCWQFYVNALKDVEAVCNENGMIKKDNGVTSQRYLEVYSWEQMLKNSNAPELNFAKQMQQAGYLDCYALISCFHYDNYKQFKNFVKNNSEKVKKYFELLRMKE